MRKIRVAKKEIVNGWRNVICVGYCNLQHLLYYKDADFNTTRREGWGADIYKINTNTVIVTGYAPFGNIHPNYELQQHYESMARAIVCDYKKDYATQKQELDSLLNEFIHEVLSNKN